ncbi:hypothetical protein AXF42_Ash002910 [Apostasia shenzhenica]|uniref:Uncharacterized protein n=1 Tax=Apostasia shenzhenica TaxID=1088818 RepID=A0A2I0A7L4_9ASPA|nr:hypothetical protein AXF42_Ash002910 [Apostasia shenzhenica]
MPLYLILKGRQQGMFTSWMKCHVMVDKYLEALYFKVKSVEEVKQKMKDYVRLTVSSHVASQCNQGQVKDTGKQVVSVNNMNIVPSGKTGAEVSIALLARFLARVQHQKNLKRKERS